MPELPLPDRDGLGTDGVGPAAMGAGLRERRADDPDGAYATRDQGRGAVWGNELHGRGDAALSAAPRVFISYVHEDKEIAEAVQRMLASVLDLENEVFLSADTTQVLAGHVWLDRIRTALESCEVLLLLLSERSINRAWVNFEAGAVWLARKPMIPICIGRMSVEYLPQPYAGIQAVELPRGAHYLLTSVHHHLGLHTEPPLDQYEGRRRHQALYERDGRVMTEEERGRIDTLDPYRKLEWQFSMWEDVKP